MTNTIIDRNQARYNGRPVIVSTVREPSGVYETGIFYRANMLDVKIWRTRNEEEAKANHAHALKICAMDEESRPLSGKYAKLAEDLRRAAEAAQQYRDHEDGGTCNFDAPSLCLPRWSAAEIKRAAKAAGLGVYAWRFGRRTRWVLSVPIPGQGNRRTKAAEAMTRELEALGYDALTYYQMD